MKLVCLLDRVPSSILTAARGSGPLVDLQSHSPVQLTMWSHLISVIPHAVNLHRQLHQEIRIS